jgi:hypothetical protein
MSKEAGLIPECLTALTPFILLSLGWLKSSACESDSDLRWIDPNSPETTPVSNTYAWKVSKLRVQNRTDTKTLKVTNSDLADYMVSLE